MSSFSRTQMNPKGFHKSQIKFYLFLLPFILFMGIPIVFVVSTALKPMDELFLFPPKLLASNPTLDNFKSLFSQAKTDVPIARYVLNSLFVTVVVIIMSIFLSSLAGFALSKMNFKGKKLIFEINQVALIFVPTAVIIPRYLIIEKIGLIDNMMVHIVTLLAIPVGLFLVKQFIDQIPDSLIEAAMIDGANMLKVYFKIILPLISPAVATVSILTFQSVWNNMDTSSYYVNQESLRTFAFYINSLSQDLNSGTIGGSSVTANMIAGQGVNAAATLIMFLPNLIIFIILQSKVMSTVAHSGIK